MVEAVKVDNKKVDLQDIASSCSLPFPSHWQDDIDHFIRSGQLIDSSLQNKSMVRKDNNMFMKLHIVPRYRFTLELLWLNSVIPAIR